jgi:hypothetical protein
MPKEKKEEESEEENEDNRIIIAGRDIAVYNQTILNKLQKYDQIIVIFLKTYLERAEYIIRQWEAIGVIPESYKREGRLIYEEKEEEIWDKRSEKPFKKTVCQITLSKQPNQFKFTKL